METLRFYYASRELAHCTLLFRCYKTSIFVVPALSRCMRTRNFRARPNHALVKFATLLLVRARWWGPPRPIRKFRECTLLPPRARPRPLTFDRPFDGLFGVQDILLDELQRARPMGQLIVQRVHKSTFFQHSLSLCQRRINVPDIRWK